MKFTIDEVKQLKADRKGKSYHSSVIEARTKEPEAFNAYQSSILEGKETAKDIQAAYRDHSHERHQLAYNAFKQAGFDAEVLEENCTKDAIRRNGAIKFEFQNSSYEEKILKASAGRVDDKNEQATLNAWSQFVKDKWFACGYEHFNDAEAAEVFFNQYPSANADSIIAGIQNIVDAYGFNKAKKKMLTTDPKTGKPIKVDIEPGKNEPGFEGGGKRPTSVVANKMAELRAQGK